MARRIVILIRSILLKIWHVSNKEPLSFTICIHSNLFINNATNTQVWELGKEDRALDIVESSIKVSYVSDEVLRCIQVGLLCGQEEVVDRPTMLTVNLMLSSETTLPSPKKLDFIFKRPSKKLDLVIRGVSCSINKVTITKSEAR